MNDLIKAKIHYTSFLVASRTGVKSSNTCFYPKCLRHWMVFYVLMCR